MKFCYFHSVSTPGEIFLNLKRLSTDYICSLHRVLQVLLLEIA